MKTQIKKMKLQLKGLARQIKQNKKLRKPSHPYHDKFIGNYSLERLSIAFRHLHVAYCITRGRTLEQCDSGVGLDRDYVNWLLVAINPDSAEKLYVIVNEKLTPSQQAVQSAHAVAEFIKQNPYSLWNNGYLVLLKDSPDSVGNMRCYTPNWQEQSAIFKEPDIGDKITAYAFFGPHNKGFKNLKLV